jgi:4-amino-4-deoxy-L-arabinose transferase-like glycosyltransferase
MKNILLIFLAALAIQVYWIAATAYPAGISLHAQGEYSERAWYFRHGQGMIRAPKPAEFTPQTGFPATFDYRQTFRRPLPILLTASSQILFGDKNPNLQRLPLAILGALAAACLYQAAFLWWGFWPALLVALAYMFYPYNVSKNVELEFSDSALINVCVCGLLLTLALWQRKPDWRIALVMGIITGLFALVRYDGSAVMILAPLYMFWWLGWNFRHSLGHLAAFLVPAIFCLIPWVAYVHHVEGVWGLGSGSGFGLWEVYNDGVYEYYPNQSIDVGIAAYWQQIPWPTRQALLNSPNDYAMDRHMTQMALDWIKQNPGRAWALIPRKIWAGFSPILSPTVEGGRGNVQQERWLYFAWFAPALAGFFVAIIRWWRAWRVWIAAAIPIAGFAAVTIVIFAHTRHRTPYDGVFFLLAAGAIAGRNCPAALLSAAPPRRREGGTQR